MALRVLLADESTTIKKVMQLALQDFGVEVKSVPIGIDVPEVARAFKPDIIFVDVLLQKKNGYEVCAEIKNDPHMGGLPVVMMWSSFMDLDERAYQFSGADGRLEKPFDVENLRSLVLELVPKTQTQKLAHFLKFPGSFTEPMQAEVESKKNAASQPQAAPVPPPPPPRQPSTAPQAAPKAAAIPPIPPVPPPPRQTPAQTSRMPAADDSADSPSIRINRAIAAAAEAADSSIFENPLPIHTLTPTPTPMPQTPVAKTAPAKAASSSWNMESFDDIQNFAADVQPQALGEDDEEEEGFAQIRLPKAPAKNTITSSKPILQREDADESEDPWSMKSLAQFKLDLPETPSLEGEDLISFDVPESDIQGTEFLLNKNAAPAPSPSAAKAHPSRSFQAPPPGEQTVATHFSFDGQAASTADEPEEELELSIDPHDLMRPSAPATSEFELEVGTDELVLDVNEVSVPMIRLEPEPERVAEVKHPAHDLAAMEPTNLEDGPVPQLSADRLEEIIRSQSREIIENVVRRVVPDIASELIRKELERLLKENDGSGGLGQ